MKKLSSTKILLIILGVAALILIGLYIYFLMSLSKIGEKQRDFAGEIVNADRIIREEKQNREKLVTYFLKDGEQALFVSNLESMCSQLSLDCLTQSLNETKEANGATKLLVMVIAAQGSFANVNALLNYFETAPYPIVLSKSGLFAKETQGPRGTAGPTEWEGVFELSVPVLINQ